VRQIAAMGGATECKQAVSNVIGSVFAYALQSTLALFTKERKQASVFC
jgi:hypothetical protein